MRLRAPQRENPTYQARYSTQFNFRNENGRLDPEVMAIAMTMGWNTVDIAKACDVTHERVRQVLTRAGIDTRLGQRIQSEAAVAERYAAIREQLRPDVKDFVTKAEALGLKVQAYAETGIYRPFSRLKLSDGSRDYHVSIHRASRPFKTSPAGRRSYYRLSTSGDHICHVVYLNSNSKLDWYVLPSAGERTNVYVPTETPRWGRWTEGVPTLDWSSKEALLKSLTQFLPAGDSDAEKAS